MRSDPATRAYVARRRADGKSKREIRRCLKRYIARQLYRALTATMTSATAATCTKQQLNKLGKQRDTPTRADDPCPDHSAYLVLCGARSLGNHIFHWSPDRSQPTTALDRNPPADTDITGSTHDHGSPGSAHTA
jgi:hypothetical protein